MSICEGFQFQNRLANFIATSSLALVLTFQSFAAGQIFTWGPSSDER